MSVSVQTTTITTNIYVENYIARWTTTLELCPHLELPCFCDVLYSLERLVFLKLETKTNWIHTVCVYDLAAVNRRICSEF